VEQPKQPTTSAVSQVKSLKAAAAARGIGQKTSNVVKNTKIKVRKPKPFEWVRVHPDIDNYSIVLPIVVFGDDSKAEDDKTVADKPDEYVIHPNLIEHPELSEDANRQKEYSLAVTRKGVAFIWPHSILDKENSWIDSEETNIAKARQMWIRQISDPTGGAYNRRESIKSLGEPTWPTEDFEKLLIEGLGDKFVADDSHPLFKKLCGLL